MLPGEDAPEIVVFEALKERAWQGVAERTGRSYADIVDACGAAMARHNHHDWVRNAATDLVLGGDILWQAMCAEWATQSLSAEDAATITQPVEDVVQGLGPARQPSPPMRTPAEQSADGLGSPVTCEQPTTPFSAVNVSPRADDATKPTHPGTQQLFDPSERS